MHAFVPWPQPDRSLVPIAKPVFSFQERENLNRVLDSSWIGANGQFCKYSENFLDEYFYASSLLVSNGSVAIILALTALGIGQGDEVLVPDLTFAATASSVIATGATPVFCDVEMDSWAISLEDIQMKISSKTKAIIVVHLYGMPGDLGSISQFANQHNLFVIEDAAESFSAEYEGHKVGTFGNVGTFSFFPNKLITSGEGGLVITRDIQIHNRMKILRGQGMDPQNRYYFLEPGFNFRMSELQAAILAAQLDRLSVLLELRRTSEETHERYLNDIALIPRANYRYKRSPWLFTVRLPQISYSEKLKIAELLANEGYETRPVFYPLSQMPAFGKFQNGLCKNADKISRESMSLPTGSHLKETDYLKISEIIRSVYLSHP